MKKGVSDFTARLRKIIILPRRGWGVKRSRVKFYRGEAKEVEKKAGTLSFHCREREVIVALSGQPHAVSSSLRCMTLNWRKPPNPALRQGSMHQLSTWSRARPHTSCIFTLTLINRSKTVHLVRVGYNHCIPMPSIVSVSVFRCAHLIFS